MVFLPQDDIWKPDIAIMNGFEKITQMGSSFIYVNVNYNGSCLWRPYQIIETTCQVDMTHFPYDRQTCALQFGTWGSSGTVKTAFGENGLQKHHNFQDNAEWSLVSLGVDNSSTYQAGTVKFHLLIERNSRFITFYMTIPTVMLAFLNVFTFIIPVETGEKSGFSMTIFLSFVVVLIVVNDYMPDNSDNISLYAAYSLTMTFFSAIVVMLTVLQIRAASFVTKRYPISNRTHRFVRKMFAIRNKICRIKDTPEQEFQEENDLVDTETKTEELEPEEVKDRLKVPMYPQYDYIYMAGENDVLFRRELTASSIRFERNSLVKGRETTITTDRAHSIDVQTQITTRDETRVLNGYVGKSDEENQQKLHDRVKRVRFPNESNVRHVVEAEINTSNTEHDSDVESECSHESLESEDLDVTNADESDENADKENDEDYQSALAVSIVKYNQNDQGRYINDDCKQDKPGNIDIKNHQSSRALSPFVERNVQHEAILSETLAGDNISDDFYEKTNNIKVVAEAEF
ncbi:neuronal acetylcholine receptor subunit beta-3-like [Dreissena polymorpha]|uniref:Uncharacterized protein n=1 Tax=Dreissena polymorpha TaxID=45954 RepID=A0A9D4QJK8_DREPO|nr:neuronal acetylcholine receptor subunit beta-3-like [Dreissena polymorpha]KAH3833923.1 hypothetical protein DPMN_107239 [Dreissena polymorpha]